MRIAVCIKQVPDTEAKIKLLADSSGIDSSGLKWIMNPYDENAVEEGLRLRDANPGSQIFIFTAGPKPRTSEVLRTALAMGADEAVAIEAPEYFDQTSTAKALAGAIKKEGAFDIILTGKLAIDDNAASVSQMLAYELGIPHVTVVSKLSLANNNTVATAEREIEGGTKEIYEVPLPCLFAANKGLNIPRYASLPGIMKAKKKTIKEYNFSDLSVDSEKMLVRMSRFKLPPEKPAVKILAGEAKTQAKELARLLRDEAKVI